MSHCFRTVVPLHQDGRAHMTVWHRPVWNPVVRLPLANPALTALTALRLINDLSGLLVEILTGASFPLKIQPVKNDVFSGALLSLKILEIE